MNYPAIQFYQRMGFVWCGLDRSLYDPGGDAAGENGGALAGRWGENSHKRKGATKERHRDSQGMA